MPRSPFLILVNVLFAGVLAGLLGCDKQPDVSSSTGTISKRPLLVMNSLLRRGQLQEAWEQADGVLENHGEDAGTVAKVARLAHQVGQRDVAAELLVKVCRLEAFEKPSRVQQAMIALIEVGKLHEGMKMLEEAIEKKPLQHETRRWLYDFYIGTENRNAAVTHGRFLLRHRKFDLELLNSLSNTERRTKDSAPLEEMMSRNPKDKRPLMGNAKHKFDQGELDESVKVLRSIVKAHADYLPAQALLGRVLAASGNLDAVEQWAASQTDAIEAYSDYWIALGDWARAKELPDQATRAYWESTRRDPDVMESWAKLSTSLKTLQSSKEMRDAEMTLTAVEERASRLSTFNQLKSKFERTGSISRETVLEIVEVLSDLGRLWEAEAWAAIASTLPEDDAIDVEAARRTILSQLDKKTPWQVTNQRLEFQINLVDLDLPSINSIAIAERELPDSFSEPLSVSIRLVNEAATRKLDVFGKTSETLDQPGIMLYQTLGCGGGTIDFDRDGWSDLYLAAAGGTPPHRDSEPNRLMRNLNGQFDDVTVHSGTGDTHFAQGVAVGDLNEDGFADLLVLNYGPNTLLINNGDGTFADASDQLPNNGDDWSASAAIADVDGDSFSDVAIINYCAGLDPVNVVCAMKDSATFRSCSPMKFNAASDQFFQSSSDGSFIDQTERWGISPTILGRGLGVVAGQLDATPGVDIFVTNDMTNNHYWSQTPGADSFGLSESAMLRGLGANDRALAQGSMGIATGDMDQDGDIDFYVTNFDKEYNTFHQQRDAGLWQDQTSSQNLNAPTMPYVGFGSEAVDLDQNGDLELVVANGHVDMFSRGDERSLYEHPMQVFKQNASGSYDSIAESIGGDYVSKPHVARALWTLDADGDHRVDFAVTHQTEPVALLVNRTEQTGDWLEVSLVGAESSRDAVGATVHVHSGSSTSTLAQTSGDGYLCSNERILRCGFPTNQDEFCDVTVTWPDGSSQRFEGLEKNRSWLIVQSQTEAWPHRLP